MTRVIDGVMELPRLKLRSVAGAVEAINLNKSRYQLNLVKRLVVEGTSLKHWAVVVFSHPKPPKNKVDDLENFVSEFIKRCNKLGLYMENHLFTNWYSEKTLKNVDSLVFWNRFSVRHMILIKVTCSFYYV